MSFKYYKRGKGELDTSNFPELVEQGIVIHHLDNRTLVSLWALNEYSSQRGKTVDVLVYGYVAHLRGDKDVFPVAQLYDVLTNLRFRVMDIQHESTATIRSSLMSYSEVCDTFDVSYDDVTIIGADASVPKFMPSVDLYASKVRVNGKVQSVEIDLTGLDDSPVVIVDDILGGGATIQMLVDRIRADGYTNPLYLWVRYNEGIHKPEFLEQFVDTYTGDEI